MDPGQKLNRRVWRLFADAGFKTFPNYDNEKEFEFSLDDSRKRPLDLHAEDKTLKISILGSNKSGLNPSSWTAHVHDYLKIKKIGKYDALLFILPKKDLTEKNQNYAQKCGAHVWTEDELSYYESIVNTIGPYAKYEMLDNLEIGTKEELVTNNFLAFRLNQPTNDGKYEFYVFTISPEKLLKTCVIYRKAIHSTGNSKHAYQRMLNRKRLPQIGNFVSQVNSILPVNIIVNLTDHVEVRKVNLGNYKDTLNLTNPKSSDIFKIGIPMKYASLELIDGQHRLFGFTHAAHPTIKENFNLVVLGIRRLKDPVKTSTFVAINDNSRRMDPNLVSFLKYTNNEKICKKDHKLMAIKIVVELNKTTPFKKKIRLLDIGDLKITLKGFSGYDLQGLVGENGALRKIYPRNSSKEFVRALRIYFSTIESLFSSEWAEPNKYIIATNRGISAFLKLLRSILRTENKKLTNASVKKYLKALKDNWTDPWETQLLKASYVGSQGWKSLYRDMVTAIKNELPTFLG